MKNIQKCAPLWSALLTLPADVATIKAALLIDKKLLQLTMNTGVDAKYNKTFEFS